MASPRKAAATTTAIVPYTLADDDDEEPTSEAQLSLELSPAALTEALAAAPPLPLFRAPGSSWASPPPHAIGGPLAMRCMRDAIALQLARRGFDGLRNSALWLITELAADFLKALGGQLRAEGGSASAGVLVKRIQRHANVRRLEEWHQAQRSFVRVSEPPAATKELAGRANPFAAKQINPALAPPAVAPLYSAMTGTLNYKTQHGSGRAAHTAAGQANDDWPTASQANPPVPAGLTGRDLSESLRLSKKQRQHAEEWLQAATRTSSHTAPVLLPGALIPPAGDDAAKGARGRKGK